VSVLADRIRGIVGVRPGLPAPSAVEAPALPAPRHADLTATLGGERRGGCYVVERRLPPTASHGSQRVGAIADCIARGTGHATLFSTAAAAPPFVFFDLETTGLSGGAGTIAFLVGCGWFEADGAFAIRQFLLAQQADERGLLELAGAELRRAGAIVSFNGRSFDAPFLETRYLFHRLPWAGEGIAHIDALHPARRFWPGDCSLSALERQVVAARRVGDVDGSEIPARYFRFIRTGDARALVAILDHNRRDLITLAALTARLLHLACGGVGTARDAREAHALGITYARAGLDEAARECHARAIAISAAPAGAYDPVRAESLRALAALLRRARRFDEAAECWRQLLDARGCPPAARREAAEALAIHHEHRVRDLSAARRFALESLDDEPRLPWAQAVQHRVARIDRKIGKSQGSSLEFGALET